MGFAEIKKSINTDLNTPLNHLSWLNDYKVFGNASYVFRNKAILNELYHSYTIVMNDESIYTEAFDAIAVEGSNVGKALAAINGIESAETLKTLSAMNAVLNSETAMNAVLNSETAMNAVANSETAMNAVLNSETAMNAVANSETAMNAVLNSETAMNAVLNSETAMNAVANSETAMNAVLNSETAMNAVANSETAMNAVANSATAMNAVAKGTSNWTTAVKKTFFTAINNSPERIKSVYSTLKNTTYFTRKISSYQDGVNGLNQYGTTSYAANGLIACFLGSYDGNNSATTNLFIDGEQVASKASSSNPTMVSESNVNAIACPAATFTETGDGQAAIEVYIAV